MGAAKGVARPRSAIDDGPMVASFPHDVPVLTDGVVTLRAARASDVDPMVAQSVDPESVNWTRVPVPYGRADAVDYIGVLADGWRSGRGFGFVIETADLPYAGMVALSAYEERGVAELAYGLHPDARGRGLCRRPVT